MSKGQILLAAGRQHGARDSGSQRSEEYLRNAEEIFLQIRKNAPNEPVVQAEAGYHLGEVYAALKDTNRAREAFRKVADDYPGTPHASKALYGLAGVLLGEADLEGAGRAFDKIKERYPKTRLADKATKKLEGIRLAGSQAPPLHIKQWIGEPPPVDEGFEGKVTVFSFWAIWCPHCKRNIPNMERLLETYGKRGVAVVGITKEREGYGIEKVKEYIDSHPMSYPTGVDDEGKTSESLAVSSIPCVVVVDPQGRVSWHGHPDYLTDRVIEVLLQPSS
jgi:thiol-disulfide isomerase/thioredoxin